MVGCRRNGFQEHFAGTVDRYDIEHLFIEQVMFVVSGCQSTRIERIN